MLFYFHGGEMFWLSIDLDFYNAWRARRPSRLGVLRAGNRRTASKSRRESESASFFLAGNKVRRKEIVSRYTAS